MPRQLRGRSPNGDQPVEKFPDLRAQQAEFQKERDQLAKRLATRRARYDKLGEQIEPLLVEQRALGREIRESEENQRLVALDNQLGGLARALGGRALTEEPR